MRHFLLPLLCFCSLTLFGQGYTGTVSPRLQARLEADPAAVQEVLILLSDRVDMDALETELQARNADLQTRTRRTITALRTKAAATQPALLRALTDSPDFDRLRPYWVTNAIFADATAAGILALADDSRVALIDYNAPLATESLTRSAVAATVAPDDIEAGLRVVNAPALWALGYSGAGRVGMVNDTGTDLEHPALANRYMGGYVADSIAFFDQAEREEATYDCGSHGTHVAGTMVGLDREHNDTIGVAFNANWTAGAMLCGIGSEDNFNSFQWAIDPDGDSTTIADQPDVINNSWYDPSLDTTDCESYYVPLLQAVEAVGIAVVFSAGNAGPEPMTITPPHNINTDIVNSFTVAAVNGNLGTLPVADFSSRGPSQCGGDSSLLIKPEVSAPGVNVRSCVPGNEYAFFSGTSMAAPHVSGVILLLKEAFPYLTGRELKLALYFSARDMGPVGEDNTFGMGMIDAKAAYDYLVAQGHVPVPATVVENDLILLDFSKEMRYCDQTVTTGEAKVYNNGSTEVTEVQLTYTVGEEQTVVDWTGSIAPGTFARITLPEMVATTGRQLIGLTVATPGVSDDLPRNNTLRRRVEVLERPALLTDVPGGTLCTPGAALLTATGTTDLTPAFEWYDALEEGNLIGTGDSLVSPETDSSTTVYLDALYALNLGLTNEAADLVEYIDPDEKGLRFDVNVPITLKSVKVYSESAGLRVIRVEYPFGNNAAGTTTVSVPAGESRVDLDFEIPAGRNYRLVVQNAGLARPMSVSRDVAEFPYTYSEVVRITGNLDPDDDDDYYFFYDWEIEFREPCGRKAVTVEVADPAAAPIADFSVPTDTLALSDAGIAAFAFTNLSEAGATYRWDFGDGTFSDVFAPDHTYDTPGEYRVTLRVAGATCTQYAVQTLVVTEPLVRVRDLPRLAALVYPNPTTAILSIELASAVATQGQLYDALGRRVRRFQLLPALTQLDVSTLTPGVYVLELRNANGVYSERVVVE